MPEVVPKRKLLALKLARKPAAKLAIKNSL